VGAHAWGLQFHLEASTATAAAWTLEEAELAGLGLSGESLVATVRARETDLRRWWSLVSDRWLGVVEEAAEARPAV
jgi:hypothetical protein